MTDDDHGTNDGIASKLLRRRELFAVGAAVSTAGCLGVFDGTGTDRTADGTGTYTTAPKTTTFSQVTGERTPYPVVQPVTIGEGRLLALYFDYAQQESIRWWQETYPEIRQLVRDGPIRLSVAHYPVPVSRWSVMLPCALIEVKRQRGNDPAAEFHRQMVDRAPDYSLSAVADAAAAVDADPATVRQAATDRRRRNQVFASRDLGQRQGVDSPPAAVTSERALSDTSAETIRSAYTTTTER